MDSPPSCPHGFLFPELLTNNSSSPSFKPISDPKARIQSKSFAHALSNSCSAPLSQLPKRCIKGDELYIKIPESEYLAGLESCKNHLHGRLMLSKGSMPMKVSDLRCKLLDLWKQIGSWNIISLGRGFYEFSFSSLEDLRSVLAIGLWNLGSGSLRLFSWTKDFIPYSLKNTIIQVWVRFYGIAQDYWRPQSLFAIAGGI